MAGLALAAGQLTPDICAKDVMLHILSQPFFQTSQIHMVELEALGAVDRRELHGVAPQLAAAAQDAIAAAPARGQRRTRRPRAA